MSQLPIIKEREDGKWHVTFLGEELLFTKNLVWIKSNVRKNAKIAKLGFRKFEVHENGNVEIFDLDAGVAKVKPRKPKTDKPEKIPENPEIEKKTVRVVGKPGTALEGYEKTGLLKTKEGRVITITFQTKRDGGIEIEYEFDAKTGEQRTENYNHIWQIADVASL